MHIRFPYRALLILLAPAAWCQTPQIAAVYDLLGRTSLCSPDSVIAYGVYPADNQPSFSATVGGETERVNFVEVTNGAGYAINFNIPADLPTGSSTVVISHDGTPSNSFPIKINAVCPGIAADGTAFSHNTNGYQVTTSYPAAPGEAIVLSMSGLGHTNPVEALGSTASSPLPSATAPTMTVGGLTATIQFAGKPSGTLGTGDDILFIVPAKAPTGAEAVVVTTDGVESNTVQLLVGTEQLPAAPTVNSMLNGASFAANTPVAPGSFLTVFGSGLGIKSNASPFPATEAEGISVQIGGEMAPISSIIESQGQINVLVPNDAPIYGTLPVTVETPNGPQNMNSSTAIQMVSAAPGIFLIPDPSNTSRQVGAANFANTAWIVLSTAQTAALGLPACTATSKAAEVCGKPAQPGDYVAMYVTGLGRATPNGDLNGALLPTGQTAPTNGTLYETPQQAVITVNGTAATVQFSGLAPGFAGLYQVNFQIPAGTPAGDNESIQISMPGSTVTDTAMIAIQ